MKKIILSSLVVIGLTMSMAADEMNLQEIFDTEKQETIAKKRVSELENKNILELEYFDYYSKRFKKDVAYINYEFNQSNLIVLENFLNKIDKDVEKLEYKQGVKYHLEIQYIVGTGMVYRVKKV